MCIVMQAAKVVQEAKEESPESEEEDWEAAAESWEDMDAVPAIGPAAEEAKRKVTTTSNRTDSKIFSNF